MLSKPLPDTIYVGGDDYLVKTDFRIWYGYMLGDVNAVDLFHSSVPSMTQECADAISGFMQPTKKYPRPSGKSTIPTIDFVGDSAFIYADFYHRYGINLTTAQLHWHEFLALFNALFVSITDIVSIRCYEGKDSQKNKQKALWKIEQEREQNDETREMERILRGEV